VNDTSPGVARRAAPAAFAVAILTIAALATGVLLLQALGGQSGRDVGAAASSAVLSGAMPLLVVAELLKIANAIGQAIVVGAARPTAGRWRPILAILGYLGAALIAASGALGLYSIAAGNPGLGLLTSALGFAGLAAGGGWVICLVLASGLAMPRWLVVVGLAFGILSLAATVIAPLAMLAGLLSIVWWFGLSRALRSSAG